MKNQEYLKDKIKKNKKLRILKKVEYFSNLINGRHCNIFNKFDLIIESKFFKF